MSAELTMLIAVLIVSLANGQAQQCNRQIRIGESESGSLTFPLRNSEVTCLNIVPPTNEENYILLKLPASVSVSYDGKTYESNDALQQYCMVLTPSKRCPLYHEKVLKSCPGGATAKPIFGSTTFHLRAIVGSSQDGSNETTVDHKFIDRIDGFFNGECVDLQPPTVVPTTDRTLPETTIPVTSAVTPKAAETEEVARTEEMEEDAASTKLITTQSSAGTADVDNSIIPYVIGIGIAVVFFSVMVFIACCVHKGRNQSETNRRRNTASDAEKGGGTATSRVRLVSGGSTPPDGSHEMMCFSVRR